MKKIILIIFTTIALISCEKELEYTVHSDFEPYIKRFINEGAKRNKSFDLHKNGLIVEFADLDYASGICHFRR